VRGEGVEDAGLAKVGEAWGLMVLLDWQVIRVEKGELCAHSEARWHSLGSLITYYSQLVVYQRVRWARLKSLRQENV
jgi:hypothetical protein